MIILWLHTNISTWLYLDTAKLQLCFANYQLNIAFIKECLTYEEAKNIDSRLALINGTI
jgi:hypothetical protein